MINPEILIDGNTTDEDLTCQGLSMLIKSVAVLFSVAVITQARH